MSVKLQMINSKRVTRLVIFIIVVSLVIVSVGAVGGAAESLHSSATDTGDEDVQSPTSAGNWTANNSSTVSDSTDGEMVRVIVRFESVPTAETVTADSIVSTRQAQADATQESFEEYTNETASLTFERGYWITNAALVSVDIEQLSLAELAEMDRVKDVSRDDPHDIGTDMSSTQTKQVTDSESTTASSFVSASQSSSSSATTETYTHGLEQIGVPAVWDEYRTRGNGTTIAVLDSGVDASHPDLTVDEWTDFTADPSTDPVVYSDHGTHVSSIATGGNASGTHIGVSPDARLLHGAVMSQCEGLRCTARQSNVLAAMEWAVEADADVISISFGHHDYVPAYIEAVETATRDGTVVVAAVGNSGNGTSISPGNLHSVGSVGAVDRTGTVPSFSSGERIDTAETWGEDAPAEWPETYVVPNSVGPGVGIKTADTDNGYVTKSGTSMATPHVAGAVALVQSSTPRELEPNEILTALYETAQIPDGKRDTATVRYGAGIINVYDAIEWLGLHGSLTGTVTDAVTGEPLSNATVEITSEEEPRTTHTDENGTYRITGLTDTHEYTLTTSKPGYEQSTHGPLSTPANRTTTQNVSLAGAGSVTVTLTDSQFTERIDHATVELHTDGRTYPVEHTETGTYTAPAVPSTQSYTLTARTVGYGAHESTVNLSSDQPHYTNDITLDGDATLVVSVTNASAEPIDSASIAVTNPVGSTHDTDTRTGPDGIGTVNVPGTDVSYTLTITADGYTTTVVVTDTISPGSTTTLSVSLTPPPRTDAVPTSDPTPGFGLVAPIIALLAATVVARVFTPP